jgi:hypothetical protein
MGRRPERRQKCRPECRHGPERRQKCRPECRGPEWPRPEWRSTEKICVQASKLDHVVTIQHVAINNHRKILATL